MKIEFYWDDLAKKKQAEILTKLGNNCNWDAFPIFILEIDDEEEQ